LNAKKAEIAHWGPEDIKADKNKIGMNGSPTVVDEIFTPDLSKDGKIYTVDQLGEAAEEIIKKQKEMGLI
jgi:electron transfer flavoprotein alpha/beta subunit